MRIKGPDVKIKNVVVNTDKSGYFSTVYFRPLFLRVRTHDMVTDVVADSISIDGSDLYFEFGDQTMEVYDISQIESIMYNILTKDDEKQCRRLLQRFLDEGS